MSNNTEKIAKLREEADRLEAADKVFQGLPQEYKLAITLHALLCQWNHTDGCGWYYEVKDGIDNWNGQSHQPYLDKAREVIAFCQKHNITPAAAVDLFTLMKKL